MSRNFPFPNLHENEAPILPVLMYHAPNRAILEEQFQWIEYNAYSPVHLDEASSYFANPKTTTFPSMKIVLTFDDAYYSFLFDVCPLLKKFNFKATLCIPTGEIPSYEEGREPQPDWTKGKGSLMTWDEIRKLSTLKTTKGEDLIEFIPHSVTHRYYDELEKCSNPESEFRWEVRVSKEMLSHELAIEIDSIKFYCFPGGTGEGKEIVERVLYEENYTGALRAQYKSKDKWNQYRIPRCEPLSKIDLMRLLSNRKFECG